MIDAHLADLDMPVPLPVRRRIALPAPGRVGRSES